jgi:hypothetical protein
MIDEILNWNEFNDIVLTSFSHHSSASDFDGITDPLNGWSSPRMVPVLINYLYHRLKIEFVKMITENVKFKFFHNGTLIEVQHSMTQDLKDDINSNQNWENEVSELVWKCLQKMFHTNFYNQVRTAKKW